MSPCLDQRGFSVAELLVAMTVGLAVLLAASSLLVSANAAYVSQVNAAAIDDAGRYALDIIGRAVRQGAYIDWEQADLARGVDDTVPARLAGLDAASISKATHGIDNPLPGAVNGSDVLAVRFAGAGDGSVNSCAGFPVGAAEEGWSIFYVARNGQGEAELRCKYRSAAGWGADAVVAGVDSFQLLFGIDTDPVADGVANRYLNASAIADLDASLALSGSNAAERGRDLQRRTWWKRVVTVKVALLLHGEREAGRPGDAAWDLFGPAYQDADAGTRLGEAALSGAANARRQRRLFAATIALHGSEG